MCPGSVLRRVGNSDKMPSVAQSRVLQAWRLERGEKSKVKVDLHIRVGGLGLVSPGQAGIRGQDVTGVTVDTSMAASHSALALQGPATD